MKTKMLFAVLFAMALGCRNEFIDPCPNDSSVAMAVAIVSDCAPPEDGISVVPAGDTTSVSDYKLHAYVYNSYGIMIKDVDWQISDNPTLLTLAPNGASAETRREATALIQTTADILDRGGDTEPKATVMACVTNNCEVIEAGCVECLPEICSPPHTVRSIVGENLKPLLLNRKSTAEKLISGLATGTTSANSPITKMWLAESFAIPPAKISGSGPRPNVLSRDALRPNRRTHEFVFTILPKPQAAAEFF
ncbi:hypothetical protein HZB93_03535 [Candidatus Falkowbacteria bacterium]|nr:hypothetical protein [Candidatus Falkowbacteria bacterium]